LHLRPLGAQIAGELGDSNGNGMVSWSTIQGRVAHAAARVARRSALDAVLMDIG